MVRKRRKKRDIDLTKVIELIIALISLFYQILTYYTR